MIPETLGAGEVRLYKSRDFPFDWQVVGSLIKGPYADPSIFRSGDRWWMFACDTPFTHQSLRLYSAPQLEGPWEEHPESPIVRNDTRIARPAGRVLTFDGRPIRFAQDCSRQYGDQVWAFEITHLTRGSYSERLALPEAIIGAGIRGNWRTSRMHHIDAHASSAGNWIACVDGWRAPEDCAFIRTRSLLSKKRSKRGLTGRLLFLIRLNRMRFLGVPAQQGGG